MDAHGFISKIHSLQYDDDVRTQLQIYKALETACSELGYDVDVTWGDGARQQLFRVTNEEGNAHAPGVLFMNRPCNNVHRCARCALQHMYYTPLASIRHDFSAQLPGTVQQFLKHLQEFFQELLGSLHKI